MILYCTTTRKMVAAAAALQVVSLITVVFLLLLLLFLNVSLQLSFQRRVVVESNSSSSSSSDNRSSTLLIRPSWQSVVSTRPIIALTTTTTSGNATNWHLDSDDGIYQNIKARSVVPGDLLSDLMCNGYIDDPYYDRNFLTQQQVWVGEIPLPINSTTQKLRPRTRTWIYSTNVTLPNNNDDEKNCPRNNYYLIVEGIKMVAHVSWNDVELGVVTNQFLRYIFPIPNEALLLSPTEQQQQQQPKQNRLTITFKGANTTNTSNTLTTTTTNGRYMACSGGWDWAPYTRVCEESSETTADANNNTDKCGGGGGSGSHRPAFTLGIVNPIYIVQTATTNDIILTDVVPKIYPLCQSNMVEPCKDFRVQVEIFLLQQQQSNGGVASSSSSSLTIQSNFSKDVVRIPIDESLEKDDDNQQRVTVVVNMTATDIELWWPSGLGLSQTLYYVDVTLEDETCQTARTCPTVRKRIGFRTVELVTSSSKSAEEEGSGDNGMYFLVNGIDIWSRGANVVPMDQLEGRFSDTGYRLLVQSAANAQMNMLRVWGGGTILLQSFYDACDEYGILLYHDLMFVEEHGHGHEAFEHPSDRKLIRHEIEGIIRKLSHHPSIVLWSGCNECSYAANSNDMELYASFVMQTVAETDDTRAIWPGSPSPSGWLKGVYTANGKPNGKPLVLQNRSSGHSVETHGPYWRGYSDTYPGVNGRPASNSNETNIPPQFSDTTEEGTEYRNTFVSEFGASVTSSFESMSSLLPPTKWSLHGGADDPPDTCQPVVENYNNCTGTNAMAERNYPCDSQIFTMFGTTNNTSLDDVGTEPFQRQLYLCMISQTLWMKGQIESMRSTNSYGALIWMLNENFPTGGWGCVEYGPQDNLKGQIVGGRWKPFMYLLKNHLFQDAIVACGLTGSSCSSNDEGEICYARNDGLVGANVFVSFEAWSISEATNKPLRFVEWYPHLDAGRSTAYYKLPTNFRDGADVVLIDYVVDVVGDGPSAATDGELVETMIRSSSAYLWNPPKLMSNLYQEVHFTVKIIIRRGGDDDTTCSGGAVTLEITSDKLALYVLLSTSAIGHFSDNAFHLRPNQRKLVCFEEIIPGHYYDTVVDVVNELISSLRIEHLGSHRSNYQHHQQQQQQQQDDDAVTVTILVPSSPDDKVTTIE